MNPVTAHTGLASVEFAVTLPVMLLLMLTTAEAGRALYSYNTLTKVVRDGARYAADYALDGVQNAVLSDETVRKAKNLVVNGTPFDEGQPLLKGFSSESVTVEILQGNGYDTPHVRVQAVYHFVPLFGNIPNLGSENRLNKGFDLQTSVVMRAL